MSGHDGEGGPGDDPGSVPPWDPAGGSSWGQFPQQGPRAWGPASNPIPQQGGPGLGSAGPRQSPPHQPFPSALGGSQAHKPGIVPLRPLTVGEILDGAVASIRAHPRVVLGVSVIVAVITQIVRGAVSVVLSDQLTRSGFAPGRTPTRSQLGSLLGTAAGGGLIALVVAVVAFAFAAGVLIVVISRSVLGQPIDGAECWRAVRGRIPGLIGIALLQALLVLIAFTVGLVPVIAVGAAAGSPVVALAVVPIALLLASFLVVAALTPVCLWSPAYVLEGIGVGAALRRSATLVRGRFWAVFGTVALTILIFVLLRVVMFAVFAIPSALASAVSVVLGAVVAGVGGILASTVSTPFVAGVAGLLYVDQRMRREAFDIQLQREIAGGPF